MYSHCSKFLSENANITILGRPGTFNITVAFFPKSDAPACLGNSIANDASFQTKETPEGFTCFNLTDIFKQRSNYSYQDLRISPVTERLNYTLGNAASYDANINYTRVWYNLRDSASLASGALGC
ncbi:MAG: hypothetical protein CL912_31755 [Deltaproteobacteria bacterium]|nr:hypothetical protein [Deltaproteobacteria bacterium]